MLIEKKPIFLVGFMGSGKSYIGKKLAENLKCPFYETDALLENKLNASIQDIFSKHGEAYFRTEESNILKIIPHSGLSIISTGGGTPCFFDNMEIMNHRGLTIFIQADIEILFNRLWEEKDKRPLLNDILSTTELRLKIEELLEKRIEFYEKATIKIGLSNKNENTILEEIKNKIQKKGIFIE
jgi:shikimate kinase